MPSPNEGTFSPFIVWIPPSCTSSRCSPGRMISSGRPSSFADCGKKPVGARLDGVLHGVEEDVGGRAFRDEGAVLEGLAGAQLEVHGVGAVADGAHLRRAVEGVLEEDRP